MNDYRKGFDTLNPRRLGPVEEYPAVPQRGDVVRQWFDDNSSVLYVCVRVDGDEFTAVPMPGIKSHPLPHVGKRWAETLGTAEQTIMQRSHAGSIKLALTRYDNEERERQRRRAARRDKWRFRAAVIGWLLLIVIVLALFASSTGLPMFIPAGS